MLEAAGAELYKFESPIWYCTAQLAQFWPDLGNVRNYQVGLTNYKITFSDLLRISLVINFSICHLTLRQLMFPWFVLKKQSLDKRKNYILKVSYFKWFYFLFWSNPIFFHIKSALKYREFNKNWQEGNSFIDNQQHSGISLR